jgi:hypothetical protein
MIFACCHIHLKDVNKTKIPGKHRKNCWAKNEVEKTKSLRMCVECNNKFQIRGENVEVETFTYLGSQLTRDGGTQIDAKTHIYNGNSALRQLYIIWKARGLKAWSYYLLSKMV